MSYESMPAAYDVIVVGGGISGICAAVAAARHDARVLVLEKSLNLGGMLTDSLVGPMMTFHSPIRQVSKGILQEIVDRLIEVRGSYGHVKDPIGFVETITPFIHEKLKVVLFELLNQERVKYLVGLLTTSAEVEHGFVRVVKASSGAKEYSFEGKVFIDATGDGSFSIKCGTPYWIGDESSRECQPMSLILRVSRVDKEKIVSYIKRHPEEFQLRNEPSKLDFSYLAVSGFYSKMNLLSKYGLSFKRDRLLFFQVPFNDDEFLINTNRYPGYGSDAGQLTYAHSLAIIEISRFLEFLRREVPGFENVELIQTGNIGVRETHHIEADYKLSVEDILRTNKFETSIAIGAYPVDVHQSESGKLSIMRAPYPREYQIPLESLFPKNLRNVLLAGRNISADHLAYAAVRVSAIAGCTGMAAGICAALAAKQDGNVRKVEYEKLRKKILEMGGVL